MISPTFFELFAFAAALAGLLAVIGEILVNDARLLGEIVTDVRRMAEPKAGPAPRDFVPTPVALGTAANSNDLRKAA